MNRWDVYAWMKTRLMSTGQIPTEEDVAIQFFPDVSLAEMTQGIMEFRRVIRGVRRRLG